MKVNVNTVIKGKTIGEYVRENGSFYYGGCFRKTNPRFGSTEYIYENTGLTDWVILEKKAKGGSFICKVVGIGQNIYKGEVMTYLLQIIDDGYGIDRASWSDDANEDNFIQFRKVEVE